MHAQLQRKRQQDARAEHDRILKMIENDKIERRHHKELRNALAKAEPNSHDEANGVVDQKLTCGASQPSQTSIECAVQVRLFDGSVVRSHFSSSQTLRTDVRRWIDD